MINEIEEKLKPLWYFASEEFIKTSKILLLNDTVNEVDVIERQNKAKILHEIITLFESLTVLPWDENYNAPINLPLKSFKFI